MQDPRYYREQAERARRLARALSHSETRSILERVARDYDDIAQDLEVGAVEIRHPELMPQRRGGR